MDTSIDSEDMNEFNKSIEVIPSARVRNLDQSIDLQDIDEHSVEDEGSLEGEEKQK